MVPHQRASEPLPAPPRRPTAFSGRCAAARGGCRRLGGSGHESRVSESFMGHLTVHHRVAKLHYPAAQDRGRDDIRASRVVRDASVIRVVQDRSQVAVTVQDRDRDRDGTRADPRPGNDCQRTRSLRRPPRAFSESGRCRRAAAGGSGPARELSESLTRRGRCPGRACRRSDLDWSGEPHSS
jgi:hypothetical protein